MLGRNGEVAGRAFERAFVFVDVHARDPTRRFG
jgi:hypothetical protein